MTKIGVALLGLVGGAAFAVGSEATKVGIKYGTQLADTTQKAAAKGYKNLKAKIKNRGKRDEVVIVEVVETEISAKKSWMPSFFRNRMKQPAAV